MTSGRRTALALCGSLAVLVAAMLLWRVRDVQPRLTARAPEAQAQSAGAGSELVEAPSTGLREASPSDAASAPAVASAAAPSPDGATVSIVLADERGRPVEGMAILLFAGPDEPVAATGADGTVVFHPRAGTYRWAVGREGAVVVYEPPSERARELAEDVAFSRPTPRLQSSGLFTLQAGDDLRLRGILQSGIVVLGTVASCGEGGLTTVQLVSRTAVGAFDPSTLGGQGMQVERSVELTADGAFRFEGVSPGYKILRLRRECAPNRFELAALPFEAREPTVDLGALELPNTYRITGACTFQPAPEEAWPESARCQLRVHWETAGPGSPDNIAETIEIDPARPFELYSGNAGSCRVTFRKAVDWPGRMASQYVWQGAPAAGPGVHVELVFERERYPFEFQVEIVPAPLPDARLELLLVHRESGKELHTDLQPNGREALPVRLMAKRGEYLVYATPDPNNGDASQSLCGFARLHHGAEPGEPQVLRVSPGAAVRGVVPTDTRTLTLSIADEDGGATALVSCSVESPEGVFRLGGLLPGRDYGLNERWSFTGPEVGQTVDLGVLR